MKIPTNVRSRPKVSLPAKSKAILQRLLDASDLGHAIEECLSKNVDSEHNTITFETGDLGNWCDLLDQFDLRLEYGIYNLCADKLISRRQHAEKWKSVMNEIIFRGKGHSKTNETMDVNESISSDDLPFPLLAHTPQSSFNLKEYAKLKEELISVLKFTLHLLKTGSAGSVTIYSSFSNLCRMIASTESDIVRLCLLCVQQFLSRTNFDSLYRARKLVAQLDGNGAELLPLLSLFHDLPRFMVNKSGFIGWISDSIYDTALPDPTVNEFRSRDAEASVDSNDGNFWISQSRNFEYRVKNAKKVYMSKGTPLDIIYAIMKNHSNHGPAIIFEHTELALSTSIRRSFTFGGGSLEDRREWMWEVLAAISITQTLLIMSRFHVNDMILSDWQSVVTDHSRLLLTNLWDIVRADPQEYGTEIQSQAADTLFSLSQQGARFLRSYSNAGFAPYYIEVMKHIIAQLEGKASAKKDLRVLYSILSAIASNGNAIPGVVQECFPLILKLIQHWPTLDDNLKHNDSWLLLIQLAAITAKQFLRKDDTAWRVFVECEGPVILVQAIQYGVTLVTSADKLTERGQDILCSLITVLSFAVRVQEHRHHLGDDEDMLEFMGGALNDNGEESRGADDEYDQEEGSERREQEEQADRMSDDDIGRPDPNLPSLGGLSQLLVVGPLPKLLSTLIDHCMKNNISTQLLYSCCVILYRRILESEPTTAKALREAGLEQMFVSSIVDMTSCPEAFISIPGTIRAVCLTSEGKQLVVNSDSIPRFLSSVFENDLSFAGGMELIRIFVRDTLELCRHVPILDISLFRGCVEMINSMALKMNKIADIQAASRNRAKVAMGHSDEGISVEDFLQPGVGIESEKRQARMMRSYLVSCQIFVSKILRVLYRLRSQDANNSFVLFDNNHGLQAIAELFSGMINLFGSFVPFSVNALDSSSHFFRVYIHTENENGDLLTSFVDALIGNLHGGRSPQWLPFILLNNLDEALTEIRNKFLNEFGEDKGKGVAITDEKSRLRALVMLDRVSASYRLLETILTLTAARNPENWFSSAIGAHLSLKQLSSAMGVITKSVAQSIEIRDVVHRLRISGDDNGLAVAIINDSLDMLAKFYDCTSFLVDRAEVGNEDSARLSAVLEYQPGKSIIDALGRIGACSVNSLSNDADTIIYRVTVLMDKFEHSGMILWGRGSKRRNNNISFRLLRSFAEYGGYQYLLDDFFDLIHDCKSALKDEKLDKSTFDSVSFSSGFKFFCRLSSPPTEKQRGKRSIDDKFEYWPFLVGLYKQLVTKCNDLIISGHVHLLGISFLSDFFSLLSNLTKLPSKSTIAGYEMPRRRSERRDRPFLRTLADMRDRRRIRDQARMARTLTRSPVLVDPEYVTRLTEMGFETSHCEHALRLTHNNLEAATEHLLTHPMPPEFEPPTSPEEANLTTEANADPVSAALETSHNLFTDDELRAAIDLSLHGISEPLELQDDPVIAPQLFGSAGSIRPPLPSLPLPSDTIMKNRDIESETETEKLISEFSAVTCENSLKNFLIAVSTSDSKNEDEKYCAYSLSDLLLACMSQTIHGIEDNRVFIFKNFQSLLLETPKKYKALVKDGEMSNQVLYNLQGLFQVLSLCLSGDAEFRKQFVTGSDTSNSFINITIDIIFSWLNHSVSDPTALRTKSQHTWVAFALLCLESLSKPSQKSKDKGSSSKDTPIDRGILSEQDLLSIGDLCIQFTTMAGVNGITQLPPDIVYALLVLSVNLSRHHMIAARFYTSDFIKVILSVPPSLQLRPFLQPLSSLFCNILHNEQNESACAEALLSILAENTKNSLKLMKKIAADEGDFKPSQLQSLKINSLQAAWILEMIWLSADLVVVSPVVAAATLSTIVHGNSKSEDAPYLEWILDRVLPLSFWGDVIKGPENIAFSIPRDKSIVGLVKAMFNSILNISESDSSSHSFLIKLASLLSKELDRLMPSIKSGKEQSINHGLRLAELIDRLVNPQSTPVSLPSARTRGLFQQALSHTGLTHSLSDALTYFAKFVWNIDDPKHDSYLRAASAEDQIHRALETLHKQLSHGVWIFNDIHSHTGAKTTNEIKHKRSSDRARLHLRRWGDDEHGRQASERTSATEFDQLPPERNQEDAMEFEVFGEPESEEEMLSEEEIMSDSEEESEMSINDSFTDDNADMPYGYPFNEGGETVAQALATGSEMPLSAASPQHHPLVEVPNAYVRRRLSWMPASATRMIAGTGTAVSTPQQYIPDESFWQPVAGENAAPPRRRPPLDALLPTQAARFGRRLPSGNASSSGEGPSEMRVFEAPSDMLMAPDVIQDGEPTMFEDGTGAFGIGHLLGNQAFLGGFHRNNENENNDEEPLLGRGSGTQIVFDGRLDDNFLPGMLTRLLGGSGLLNGPGTAVPRPPRHEITPASGDVSAAGIMEDLVRSARAGSLVQVASSGGSRDLRFVQNVNDHIIEFRVTRGDDILAHGDDTRSKLKTAFHDFMVSEVARRPWTRRSVIQLLSSEQTSEPLEVKKRLIPFDDSFVDPPPSLYEPNSTATDVEAKKAVLRIAALRAPPIGRSAAESLLELLQSVGREVIDEDDYVSPLLPKRVLPLLKPLNECAGGSTGERMLDKISPVFSRLCYSPSACSLVVDSVVLQATRPIDSAPHRTVVSRYVEVLSRLIRKTPPVMAMILQNGTSNFAGLARKGKLPQGQTANPSLITLLESLCTHTWLRTYSSGEKEPSKYNQSHHRLFQFKKLAASCCTIFRTAANTLAAQKYLNEEITGICGQSIEKTDPLAAARLQYPQSLVHDSIDNVRDQHVSCEVELQHTDDDISDDVVLDEMDDPFSFMGDMDDNMDERMIEGENDSIFGRRRFFDRSGGPAEQEASKIANGLLSSSRLPEKPAIIKDEIDRIEALGQMASLFPQWQDLVPMNVNPSEIMDSEWVEYFRKTPFLVDLLTLERRIVAAAGQKTTLEKTFGTEQDYSDVILNSGVFLGTDSGHRKWLGALQFYKVQIWGWTNLFVSEALQLLKQVDEYTSRIMEKSPSKKRKLPASQSRRSMGIDSDSSDHSNEKRHRTTTPKAHVASGAGSHTELSRAPPASVSPVKVDEVALHKIALAIKALISRLDASNKAFQTLLNPGHGRLPWFSSAYSSTPARSRPPFSKAATSELLTDLTKMINIRIHAQEEVKTLAQRLAAILKKPIESSTPSFSLDVWLEASKSWNERSLKLIDSLKLPAELINSLVELLPGHDPDPSSSSLRSSSRVVKSAQSICQNLAMLLIDIADGHPSNRIHMIKALTLQLRKLTSAMLNELNLKSDRKKSPSSITTSAFLRVMSILSPVWEADSAMKEDHDSLPEYLSEFGDIRQLWSRMKHCMSQSRNDGDHSASLKGKGKGKEEISASARRESRAFSIAEADQPKQDIPTELVSWIPILESFVLLHESEPILTLPRDTSLLSFSVLASPQMRATGDNNSDADMPPINLVAGQSSSQLDASYSPIVARENSLSSFLRTHRDLLNAVLHETGELSSNTGPLSLLGLDNNERKGSSIGRTLAKYPQFLDFQNKRAWFKLQIEGLSGAGNRRGFFDRVQLNIRRNRIFEDSFHALQSKTSQELRGPLSVSFRDEAGVDAGGVRREWFLLLSRAIFNPDYVLFKPSAGKSTTFQPNAMSFVNESHLDYFRFVGKFIGMAIHHGKLIDAYFTRSFYMHILGKKPLLSDMEAVDPEFYKSLIWMLNNDIENVVDETFSAEVQEFGTSQIVDLMPDGRSIPVTEENKRDYVDLVAEHKMTSEIRTQIEAFLEGFYGMIPKNIVRVFDEKELEILISGLPEIDLRDLRSNTKYRGGYMAGSLQVQWLWRALFSFTKQQRAMFIQFVTGTSKVPLEGFKTLQGMHGTQVFNIHKTYGGDERLPTAHTCFNQLDLPEYTSYQALRDQILMAIVEGTEGFGLA